jgi:hypothetical protein
MLNKHGCGFICVFFGHSMIIYLIFVESLIRFKSRKDLLHFPHLNHFSFSNKPKTLRLVIGWFGLDLKSWLEGLLSLSIDLNLEKV